jgi:hypothetical protein
MESGGHKGERSVGGEFKYNIFDTLKKFLQILQCTQTQHNKKILKIKICYTNYLHSIMYFKSYRHDVKIYRRIVWMVYKFCAILHKRLE